MGRMGKDFGRVAGQKKTKKNYGFSLFLVATKFKIMTGEKKLVVKMKGKSTGRFVCLFKDLFKCAQPQVSKEFLTAKPGFVTLSITMLIPIQQDFFIALTPMPELYRDVT